MMNLGEGSIISMSNNKKLNIKSSTERELVGADDSLGKVIGTKHFIEGQGYTVKHNTIYQDNRSIMLPQMNGRGSNGNRSKHIKAVYYMVKDTVYREDMKIEWCPTEEMWAYVLTKPKQGK